MNRAEALKTAVLALIVLSALGYAGASDMKARQYDVCRVTRWDDCEEER